MNLIERCPIIYHLSYKLDSKEIVYQCTSNYEQSLFRQYDVINHLDYVANPHLNWSIFKPYKTGPEYTETHAFGILFNPYNSRVVVLDIDDDNNDTIDFIVKFLMNHPLVEAIDIAASSRSTLKATRRHIYAGLTQPCKVFDIYELGIKGTCQGFNALVSKKKEIVIRVSQKFYNGVPDKDTIIEWEVGYTKIGEGNWIKFTSEQLIAPLISADAQFFEKKEPIKSSLILRG